MTGGASRHLGKPRGLPRERLLRILSPRRSKPPLRVPLSRGEERDSPHGHPQRRARPLGSKRLSAAHPERASKQAAYMKRALPFRGLGRVELDSQRRDWKRRWPLRDAREYESIILDYWDLPFQEGR